jgi:hypothetical protein
VLRAAEQRREAGRGIEPRQAQPVDRTVSTRQPTVTLHAGRAVPACDLRVTERMG